MCVCGVDILMSEGGPAQYSSILDVFFLVGKGVLVSGICVVALSQ